MRTPGPVELYAVSEDVFAASDGRGTIIGLLDREDLRDLAYTAMAMLGEVPELTFGIPDDRQVLHIAQGPRGSGFGGREMMYLSDDMTEQELLDTAAEQRAEAKQDAAGSFRPIGPWAVPEPVA